MATDLTSGGPLTPSQRVQIALLKWAHISILIFVMTAWLWPWPSIWLLHAAFVPIMVLHWKTYDGCILTAWECRIKGIPPPETEEDSPFITWLFKVIFRRDPDPKILDRLIDVVVWTAASLSLGRWFFSS